MSGCSLEKTAATTRELLDARKAFNRHRSLAHRFHDPGREMYLRANPKIQGVGDGRRTTQGSGTGDQHCTGGRGEDPRASAKPVRLCQAGVEGPTRGRGGTDPFSEDGGVASRQRLRSNRPTDPNRSGPGTRLPSEAGLCRGARAGPTRWPAAAETYGRAPSEAARPRQDHDGEIDPADRRGTNRETVSQSRGPQFLLGRRRRDAQVLRGHPCGSPTSGDSERFEDQLDLRTGESRTRVPGPHLRGQERPRPDAQGQGRGEDSAEHQPPRTTRQVILTRIEFGTPYARFPRREVR